MNHVTFLVLFALSFVLTACGSPHISPPLPSIETGELTLKFSGFRNDIGEALIFIYPNSKGFPEQDGPGIIRFHQSIHNQQALVNVTDLPYHDYAIAILHDENKNGLMDKSYIGFPLEGFGFSRNPKPLLGPPQYAEARFLFTSGAREQSIQLQYPKMKKLRPERARHAAKRLK